MTNGLVFSFDVESINQVPKVGGRRTFKLNGKPEVLWCSRVEVKAKRWEPGKLSFVGEAEYKGDLWA